MAFNPQTNYRGDHYIYGGLAGLGSGIADAINGWRARENENAELGSYLAEVGLPQERIDSMDLSQRRGIQKALDFKIKQNQAAAELDRIKAENAYRGVETDLAMLGLDSTRRQMEDNAAALEMLGANYRGYAQTPQYLRDPNYDPMEAAMKQAFDSGDAGAAMAIKEFMNRQLRLELFEGPNGVIGWRIGNQGGVVMPKASGSDFSYESPYGKALCDARKFEMMGSPAEAALIRDNLISKMSMDDGISELELMILKNSKDPEDKAKYNQIMQNRAARKVGWQYYLNLVNNPQANFVGEMPPAVNEAPMPAAAQPDVPVTQRARGSVDRIIKERK